MSDEQVDLNALIQTDRKQRWSQKQKKRQQYRKQRTQRHDSRRDYDERDRSRDNRRDSGRRDREQKADRRHRGREERPRQQLFVQSYAISATGFVSDVSLDDILNLTKGKKIINIKAFFERQDGQPIEPGKDNAMNVIINFVNKQEADEFIKEYADKKLDGKTPLQFQFRRGIVSRRPQPKQNNDSEEQGNVEKKSEQEENSRNN